MIEDKKNYKKSRRSTKLVSYIGEDIKMFRRADVAGELPEEWMIRQLRSTPNFHSKMPGLKQRTPNVAIDNLCLFLNTLPDCPVEQRGKVCTILGFFDKEVKDFAAPDKMIRLRGWVLSGGHVEYDRDADMRQCALKELAEEFSIDPSDIIVTKPVAMFDDAFRDQRNRYITTVFAHWVNAAPRPSDEHKKIIIVSLERLKHLIDTGEPVSVEEGKEYRFLHGHDSMLKALLEHCPAVDSICKDIAETR